MLIILHAKVFSVIQPTVINVEMASLDLSKNANIQSPTPILLGPGTSTFELDAQTIVNDKPGSLVITTSPVPADTAETIPQLLMKTSSSAMIGTL